MPQMKIFSHWPGSGDKHIRVCLQCGHLFGACKPGNTLFKLMNVSD